jgi:hypothetical protein
MVKLRQNKTWEFEVEIKETKKKIKSWFYSDTYEDAKDRIENYMNANIISLKEIEDPLKGLQYGKSNREKIKKTEEE